MGFLISHLTPKVICYDPMTMVMENNSIDSNGHGPYNLCYALMASVHTLKLYNVISQICKMFAIQFFNYVAGYSYVCSYKAVITAHKFQQTAPAQSYHLDVDHCRFAAQCCWWLLLEAVH